MIPKIFHRTLKSPDSETEESYSYWLKFQVLHPGWAFHTYTGGDIFMSDQARLLALIHYGGIYVDWDIEPLRSWEPLLVHHAFVARDRGGITMNAVMGCEPDNMSMRACLKDAINVYANGGSAQDAGCGVTDHILPQWTHWTYLPTSYFYPYDWTEMDRKGEDFSVDPVCYGVHHWAASWLGQPRGLSSRVLR